MKWIEIKTLDPKNFPITRGGNVVTKNKNGFIRSSTPYEFRELWLLLGDDLKYILDENDDSDEKNAFSAAKEKKTLSDFPYPLDKYRTYQDYKDAQNG